MKVTCPNCQTKYNLPEEKIPGDGANVRCSRCSHVFHVDAPAPPPPPEIPAETPAAAPDAPDVPDVPDAPDAQTSEPGPTAQDQDLDDLFGDVEPAAPEASGPTDAPETAASDLDDLFDAPDGDKGESAAGAKNDGIEDLFGGPDEPEANTGAAKPIAFETEKKGLGKGGLGLGALAKTLAKGKDTPKLPGSPKNKLAALIAAAVLVLALAGAGALYFLKIGPFAETKPVETAEKPAPPKAEEKKTEDNSKNLALISVRQYMVDNTKTGNIFVIEGKVKNNFTSPKEYIKIEASLFDDKGISLASKQIVAGNTVSYFQLQTLGTEELETALNSQVGILTNNVNVRPGGEVPFMILFYNPPDTLQEFGVKVVEANDPS